MKKRSRVEMVSSGSGNGMIQDAQTKVAECGAPAETLEFYYRQFSAQALCM